MDRAISVQMYQKGTFVKMNRAHGVTYSQPGSHTNQYDTEIEGEKKTQ